MHADIDQLRGVQVDVKGHEVFRLNGCRRSLRPRIDCAHKRHCEGGLVVMPGVYMNVHRATTISLAARHNVPALYTSSDYVRDGGLLSYGADLGDMFRRAATYVNQILRGTNPAELPVQLPVKFIMTLNATTAKALGLAVPPSILLRADEVIE